MITISDSFKKLVPNQEIFFVGKNNGYHKATFLKRKGIYFVLLFENKKILRMNGDIFLTELEVLEWCYNKEARIRERLKTALDESEHRAMKYFDHMINIHLEKTNDSH